MEPNFLTWEEKLKDALKAYIYMDEDEGGDPAIFASHIEKTPDRVVAVYKDMIAGMHESPTEILGTKFDCDKHDQMIHRRSIRVVSTCMHHALPFLGKAHFAYIPNTHIVGISKIPRLVRCFSRRLQVQERLTDQIVDAFQEIVQPVGCGIYIKAYHFCEIVRGVEEYAATTETTALRGNFKTNAQTRAEFLNSINIEEIVFP